MKACVVFLHRLSGRAASMQTLLDEQGYSVCLEAVDEATAKALIAVSTNIPASIKDCLQGADVCVLLLGQEEMDRAIGAIGGLAADMGCRVVGLTDGIAAELDDLDDIYADAVVPQETEDLLEVMAGKDRWPTGPSGESIRRSIPRIKCQ